MTTKTKSEKPMMRFELLRGGHTSGSVREGNYKFYEIGDIVESEIDLGKKFGKNKFEKLEDD